MRLVGYMVVRNEADRYLQACLTQALEVLDKIVVVDDCSDDLTPDVVCSFDRAIYMRRPVDVPTFMEDESALRSWAWKLTGDMLGLKNEWVFALDGDDQLFGDRVDWEDYLADTHHLTISPVINQIWSSNPISRRIDGFWLESAPKASRYIDDVFVPKKMGGGSFPQVSMREGLNRTEFVFPMGINHWGYADPNDRLEKYDRYYVMGNTHGHNQNHINSIIRLPVLEPVDAPEFWRGVR